MKPLLITAAIALLAGGIGCLVRFWQLWQRKPSVRSLVSTEESEGRFLLGGLALLGVALAMAWLA